MRRLQRLGELAGGLAFYAATALAWTRLRVEDVAFTVATTILATFSTSWFSLPRYFLTLYPAFLLLGRLSPRTLLAAQYPVTLYRFLNRPSKSTPPVYAALGRNRSASGSRRLVAVSMTPIDDWFANSRFARPTV